MRSKSGEFCVLWFALSSVLHTIANPRLVPTSIQVSQRAGGISDREPAVNLQRALGARRVATRSAACSRFERAAVRYDAHGQLTELLLFICS